MINRKSVIVGLLGFLIVASISCAETAPSVLDGASIESFDKWMAKYDPQAQKMGESDIYIHFRERGDIDFIKPKPDTTWFEMDYTAYNLSNMIITTRNKTVSELLGCWLPTTHFVDDLVPYQYLDHGEGFVCKGLYESFQYLRIGDSARIYIPESLAYQTDGSSSTNKGGPLDPNTGYKGDITAYALKPIYIDVRVKDIINDLAQHELDQLESYVRQEWGQSVRDSIYPGVYMRVLEDYPAADVITADSTVRYFFAERFLDHQLITTNVKTVAQRANYYDYLVSQSKSFGSTTFASTDFDKAKADSTTNSIYAKVFLKVKSGQTVEVATIARWTSTGVSGSTTAIPQILPFQARRFQIRTLKWNESDKEASHDLSKLL